MSKLTPEQVNGISKVLQYHIDQAQQNAKNYITETQGVGNLLEAFKESVENKDPTPTELEPTKAKEVPVETNVKK